MNKPNGIYFRKCDSSLCFYRHDEGVVEKQGELAIEWDDLISRFITHDIPTEGEIEHAINYLEDTIMSRTDLINRSDLSLCSDDLELINLLDPEHKDENTYTREDIEKMFSRYALLSMGRSPVYEGVKMDVRQYMALLVVREVLHHMNFGSLRLVREEIK